MQKAKVKVVYNGVVLSEEVDYSLANNKFKAVGKGYLTVNGKGGFTGSVKVLVKELPKSVSVKSIKAKKRSMTVYWKKSSKGNATGYKIYYKTTKAKHYKTVTVRSYKSAAKTIKRLAKGKKYDVWMRVYKTVSVKYERVDINNNKTVVYKRVTEKMYSAYSKIKVSKKIK